jgi:hypothetical protein
VHIEKGDVMDLGKYCITEHFSITDWSRWRVEIFEKIFLFQEKHGRLPNSLIGNKKMGEKLDALSVEWLENQEAGGPEMEGFVEIAMKLAKVCELSQCALGYVLGEEEEDDTFFMACFHDEEEEDETTFHEMSLHLGDWTHWDREIYEHAVAFEEVYDTYPNLLCANPVTFARLNLQAVNTPKKENIVGPDGESPEPDEFPELQSFCCEDFELTFCLNDELEDGHLILIFDANPDFTTPDDDGGEPVPVTEEEEPLRKEIATC